jgi:hypothetical protein
MDGTLLVAECRWDNLTFKCRTIEVPPLVSPVQARVPGKWQVETWQIAPTLLLSIPTG